MTDPRRWDLFCRIVDNYGDIGVSWRLARRLVAQSRAVRLWVDDLATLQLIAPAADPGRAVQDVDGIEVRRWERAFDDIVPGDVCVESFGCGLPERYVEAMAQRSPASLWIVLEYLSAEPWVRTHHGLPSPHPRWPVRRYFFFPGFERGTGGLLREPDLLERRDAHDVEARRRYWRGIGFEPPADGATVVSVFAYPEAPLTALLGHWQHAAASHVVAVPAGALAAVAAGFFGCTGAAAGTTVRRGALELRVLPFVPQRQYDELLWSADCNFVRGEDTLVRAQWAARPYVWHAYAQAEQSHRVKLDALLDLYCGGMQDDAAASAVRDLWRAWNQTQRTPVALGPAWDRYWAQRAALAAHGHAWARRLAEAGELAENLAEFAREKLK